MARTVAGPKPGSTRTFTPKAFDNHKDDSPVTVQLTTPTEGEKRDIVRSRRVAVHLDDDGRPENIEPVDKMAWKYRAVANHAVTISNYTVAWGVVTTGLEMIEHGEIEFIEEIAYEIMTATSLSVGEIKNSEGSLESCEPATLAGASTAETAQPVDSLKSVAVG